MSLLTRNRTVIDDRWALLPETATIADVPVSTPAIVGLAGDVARLPLIAVDFPKFGDGRGYSTARLLREKYRYTGELRAIGDILRDQLYFLLQCGFDTFALQPGRDVAGALAAFDDFSDSYQATVAQPLPLFRRRLQAGGIAGTAE